MYKMVISDFDKTLIDDDLSIPISTVLTIDDIRRNNVKFIVATGRGVNFIKYYIKDVNFIDYIISLNGSYIYDVVREKIIFDKALKITDIKKIVNTYRKKPTKIYLYTDNSRCYLNDLNEDTKEIVIRDLNDFLKNNKVYKIEIHTKTNKLRKEIEKEINELYDLSINLQEYESKDYLVEICNKNISKYTGALYVCKKEKIEMNDVVAFGDNYNDIELLKNAGMSIAVKNAVKEVKKIASKTTSSNNEKGVEKSIKDIFKL